MKTFLIIALAAFSVFSLNKYTVPFHASDSMTATQYNSNNDTAKAYLDKVIDTLNSNVPRYTQNAFTHDKVMPYLRADTIRSNPNIDSISGKPIIDSINYIDVQCSLFTASTHIATATGRILFIGQLKFLFIPELTGTLVYGNYHTIRINTSYMPTVNGYKCIYPIVNNSIVEPGVITTGTISAPLGFSITNSADAGLSGGTGGIKQTILTYY